MPKITISANDGAVSVNSMDSTGASNGYYAGDLSPGESAEYEVSGNQTLVIMQSRSVQSQRGVQPESKPVEVIAASTPAPTYTHSANFDV